MPETALLRAFMFFFKFQVFNSIFLGEVEILASLMFETPVYWEYHILPGHRLFSVLAERSSFSFNESFHHTRGPA